MQFPTDTAIHPDRKFMAKTAHFCCTHQPVTCKYPQLTPLLMIVLLETCLLTL